MENRNIVIGIEGMVASGKTSICKELVKLIPNSIFIDGGNIYRGITYALAKASSQMSQFGLTEKQSASSGNIDPLELMKKLQVEFKIENNITEIYIAGEKINEENLQSIQNGMNVSQMASKINNETLFGFARKIIESYAKAYNMIVSARDLVDIYPDMDVHAYITASLEERVRRRFNQYNGIYTMEKVKEMIEERDKLHDKAGFNKTCASTITVDVTDCASAKDASLKVIEIAKEKGLIKL